MSNWTIFSNHGHVLLFLAKDPDARLRDVAQSVGITERAVQKIVHDLQKGGIITISKHGRRNRYRIHTRKPLRHALESHRTIGNLVSLMREDSKPKKPRSKTAAAVVPAPSAKPDSKPAPEKEPVPALEAEAKPAPKVEEGAEEEFSIESIGESYSQSPVYSDPPFDPDPAWREEFTDESPAEQPEPISEPESAPEPEPKPEPEPEPEPKPKPKTVKKKSKKKAIDDQQGSLF